MTLDQLDEIFICENCLEDGQQTAGTYHGAMHHERETGHRTRRCTDEEASVVRDRWTADGLCLRCGGKHQAPACPWR